MVQEDPLHRNETATSSRYDSPTSSPKIPGVCWSISAMLSAQLLGGVVFPTLIWNYEQIGTQQVISSVPIIFRLESNT